MTWYKRVTKNILTPPEERREAPDGLWVKCPECKKPTHIRELHDAFYVCPHCDYHHRIGSDEYFEFLFNDGQYEELFANLLPTDPLNFVDTKPYKQRIRQVQEKTKLKEAVRIGVGKLGDFRVVIGAMDFRFIGGSMGSVVGEKIKRAFDYAMEHRLPVIMITKSGGARMMESTFSLMQMAKTAAKVGEFHRAKLPYIVVLTDPTTGGVTASFAMLGDIHIAEPGALIGFAGPRVIQEMMKQPLPEGFQTAEFLQEHGFIDFVIHRHNLKQQLELLLTILLNPRNGMNVPT
jgi:acetyl-CoA carboxylase carboxyl transferase subunit beta